MRSAALVARAFRDVVGGVHQVPTVLVAHERVAHVRVASLLGHDDGLWAGHHADFAVSTEMLRNAVNGENMQVAQYMYVEK